MPIIPKMTLNNNVEYKENNSIYYARNVIVDTNEMSLRTEDGLKIVFDCPQRGCKNPGDIEKIVSTISCNTEIVVLTATFDKDNNILGSNIYRYSDSGNISIFPALKDESQRDDFITSWVYNGGIVKGEFTYNYVGDLIVAIAEHDVKGKMIPLVVLNLDNQEVNTSAMELEKSRLSIANMTPIKLNKKVGVATKYGTYQFYIRYRYDSREGDYTKEFSPFSILGSPIMIGESKIFNDSNSIFNLAPIASGYSFGVTNIPADYQHMSLNLMYASDSQAYRFLSGGAIGGLANLFNDHNYIQSIAAEYCTFGFWKHYISGFKALTTTSNCYTLDVLIETLNKNTNLSYQLAYSISEANGNYRWFFSDVEHKNVSSIETIDFETFKEYNNLEEVWDDASKKIDIKTMYNVETLCNIENALYVKGASDIDLGDIEKIINNSNIEIEWKAYSNTACKIIYYKYKDVEYSNIFYLWGNGNNYYADNNITDIDSDKLYFINNKIINAKTNAPIDAIVLNSSNINYLNDDINSINNNLSIPRSSLKPGEVYSLYINFITGSGDISGGVKLQNKNKTSAHSGKWWLENKYNSTITANFSDDDEGFMRGSFSYYENAIGDGLFRVPEFIEINGNIERFPTGVVIEPCIKSVKLPNSCIGATLSWAEVEKPVMVGEAIATNVGDISLQKTARRSKISDNYDYVEHRFQASIFNYELNDTQKNILMDEGGYNDGSIDTYSCHIKNLALGWIPIGYGGIGDEKEGANVNIEVNKNILRLNPFETVTSPITHISFHSVGLNESLVSHNTNKIINPLGGNVYSRGYLYTSENLNDETIEFDGYELNPDGSIKQDNMGNPIPIYRTVVNNANSKYDIRRTIRTGSDDTQRYFKDGTDEGDFALSAHKYFELVYLDKGVAIHFKSITDCMSAQYVRTMYLKDAVPNTHIYKNTAERELKQIKNLLFLPANTTLNTGGNKFYNSGREAAIQCECENTGVVRDLVTMYNLTENLYLDLVPKLINTNIYFVGENSVNVNYYNRSAKNLDSIINGEVALVVSNKLGINLQSETDIEDIESYQFGRFVQTNGFNEEEIMHPAKARYYRYNNCAKTASLINGMFGVYSPLFRRYDNHKWGLAIVSGDYIKPDNKKIRSQIGGANVGNRWAYRRTDGNMFIADWNLTQYDACEDKNLYFAVNRGVHAAMDMPYSTWNSFEYPFYPPAGTKGVNTFSLIGVPVSDFPIRCVILHNTYMRDYAPFRVLDDRIYKTNIYGSGEQFWNETIGYMPSHAKNCIATLAKEMQQKGDGLSTYKLVDYSLTNEMNPYFTNIYYNLANGNPENQSTKHTINNKGTANNKQIRRSHYIKDEMLTSIQWLMYDVDDYKNLNDNKGDIKSLRNMNNQLLVHTEHSLFVLKTDNKLQTQENQSIQLELPDIFDVHFQQIFPSQKGYAGIQDQFASNISELGYIWFDNDSNNLFYYTDKINDITEDIKQFMNCLRVDVCRIGLDKSNKRFVVSLRGVLNDGSNVSDEVIFTLSYHYELKTWISFHDYTVSHKDYGFINTKDHCYLLNYDKEPSKIATFSKNDKFSIGLIKNFDIDFDPIFDRNKTNDHYDSYIQFLNNATRVTTQKGNIDITDFRVKYLNAITYFCKIWRSQLDLKLMLEDYKDYSGDFVQFQTDEVTTPEYNISIEPKDGNTSIIHNLQHNKYQDYTKPYFDKGGWNYNYFRDVRNNRGVNNSDNSSIVYGRYIVTKFRIDNSKNRYIEFKEFKVNINLRTSGDEIEI